MINYLKGKLVSKVEDSPTGCHITIDVNDIGYLALTNKRIISLLPEEGETVTIYTSLIHKEDTMHLCGFSSREERDLFNILNSVSGIGTKAALAILGELDAYSLITAVVSGNDKAISRAKGVGSKLAQKIIIELKDKMTNWRDLSYQDGSKTFKIEGFEMTESCQEAESVLLSLGYTRKEVSEGIKKAVSSVENKNNTEEILRTALQWLVQ